MVRPVAVCCNDPISTAEWLVQQVLPCYDSDDSAPGCVGGSGSAICKAGLAGSYCKLCASPGGNYYDAKKLECTMCGSLGSPPAFWVILAICLLLLAKAALTRNRMERMTLMQEQGQAWLAQAGLLNKLKLLFSMFQAINLPHMAWSSKYGMTSLMRWHNLPNLAR